MAKYERPQKGEWVQPIHDGYKAACCDCGLVHQIEFRVVSKKTGKIVQGYQVQFNADRHPRATAAVRRKPHTYTKKET